MVGKKITCSSYAVKNMNLHIYMYNLQQKSQPSVNYDSQNNPRKNTSITANPVVPLTEIVTRELINSNHVADTVSPFID